MGSTVIAATQRERSFGGKSGIWFRKRKLTDGPGHEFRTTSKSKILLGVSDHGEKNQKQSKLSIPQAALSRIGASTTSTLIGWDDVRCRPVYRESLGEPHALNKCRVDDDDNKDDSSTTILSNTNKSNQSPDQRPTSKRTYGGARRPRALADDDHSVMDPTSPTNNPLTHNEQEEKFESNHQTITSSHQTAKTPPRNDDNSAFDFTEEVTNQLDRDTSKLPKIEIKTTPQQRAVGVSSMTSLSAARDFFRKLDRDHALTLTTEPSTSPRRRRSKRAGRSKRNVSHHRPQLLKEYSEYIAACQNSLVSPMTKEEYISNRRSVFRSTEIYDGFLDE